MTGNTALPDALPAGTTVWEHCLGTGVAPNPLYYNSFNPTLRDVLRKPPGRILELGCSAGKLGEFIREKYPGTHHTGIEMNPEAAALARGRLDHVIESRLEDIDFAAEGIAEGSIDTFIAGDVLEHLYDPWRALVRVRPLLAANRGNPSVTVQVGRVKLENLSESDLLEYCSLQFVALATPKPAAANDPSAA